MTHPTSLGSRVDSIDQAWLIIAFRSIWYRCDQHRLGWVVGYGPLSPQQAIARVVAHIESKVLRDDDLLFNKMMVFHN